MIVHFDADLLVYRAGFAAEKMHYYLLTETKDGDESAMHFPYKKELVAYAKAHGLEGDDLRYEQRREVEPLKNALYNVKSLIRTTLEALECSPDELRLYLSGPTNFRAGLATLRPYKGNRDPDHKPVHGPKIKEFMHKRYDVTVSEDEEADDVVAYSHYAMYLEDPYSSVIVSVDKDLDMIPGLHYNFVKELLYFVSEDEADFNFMCQLLEGDATDNIQGIPGMGPKKSQAALNDLTVEERWQKIRALYVQAYEDDWRDALIENGQLLWIRREPGQFWLPPEGL